MPNREETSRPLHRTRPGGPRSMTDARPRFSILLASLGGIGRLPIAPGTIGSAATVGFYLLLPVDGLVQLGGLACVIAAAVWSAEAASRVSGKDPSYVVIDEMAGQLIACFLLPKTVSHLTAAFLLFRIFDIGKWFPMKQLERLPGGWGIVADDLAAGLLTRCVLWMGGRWL